MNKKIFFLVLIYICFFTIKAFTQCIPDQHVINGNTDWQVSHGTWTPSTNDAPTSTNGACLSLYSYLSKGNGAFIDYPFVLGKTYRVCYWVRNVSACPSNPHGRLYVYAASGLVANPPGPNNVPFAVKQLIDNSYYGPPQGNAHGPSQNCVHDWEFVSATFTANDNHQQLWFYPLNTQGPPPPGNAQWSIDYVVEVDDIRVEDITAVAPPSFSASASKDPIDGCNDQTTITLKNGAANVGLTYAATWTPNNGLTYNNANRTEVVAKPCSTTTYKIEISDPDASCGDCVREVIYYTVNVNQWSDPANIVYNPTVSCPGTINLDYNDPGTCAGVTYTWIDPQMTSYNGIPQSIPASALMTGEWTLQVSTGNSCPEEHKFFIAVGSCCRSSPSFTWDQSSCNPISFTNTSTGNASLVGVLWSFGDGSTSDQMNPTHTYHDIVPVPPQTTVNKTVCLTMIYEDDQGESCCERFCNQVKVCPSPCSVDAEFEMSYVGGPHPTFDFFDYSTGNGGATSGNFCEYRWNFGDGTPVLTHGPFSYTRHSFGTPGPWFVCLTVKNCFIDANGDLIECEDSKCMWVYPPSPSLVPDVGEPVLGTMPVAGSSVIGELDEQGNDKWLTVYPNPNKGNFTLNLNNRKGSYEVIIRDKLGREVYKRKHEFNNTPVNISLNDVFDGIYTVEVKNSSEKFVQQISITK